MNIENEVRPNRWLCFRLWMEEIILFSSSLDSEASISQGPPCE